MSDLPTPSSQLSEVEITRTDVYTALCTLDDTKAFGPDEIHPKVLKECPLPLVDFVHSLFVLCLTNGLIPAEWKTHKITPIPKKGDLLEISNYRPISLLCILSKAFESIIFQKIIDFISPKLSQYQFGFIKNKSCLTQLLSAFSIIHQAVDNKQQVDMVYLDFRKAFDSVPHQELLYKLWRMGITGNLWCWFRNYLSGRSHYVLYENEMSSTLPVISGVPQGSILGPLLFIVYVNDIPEAINYSHCYLFADDAKLLQVINSPEDQTELQEDLSAISSWCKKWNLTLNSNKCSAVHFSTQSTQQLATYSIDARIIPFFESQRDLGVIVSDTLSWSHQCDLVCSKAYRALHVIRRNVPPTSHIRLKKQLYLILVKSHVSYCCQLWRPYLLKDIQSIERIQRRATKYILNDYDSDYRSRLLSLNMLPLMYWLDLQDLVFLVKCLKDPNDTLNIHQYITFVSSSTRAGTNNNLCHKFSRLNSTRHFYFVRIVRLWNAIPNGILDSNLTVQTNKLRLREYLWEHFARNFNPIDFCTYHYLCPCHKCI